MIQDYLSLSVLSAPDRALIQNEILQAGRGLSEADRQLLIAPLLEQLKEEGGDKNKFAEATAYFDKKRAQNLIQLNSKYLPYVSFDR